MTCVILDFAGSFKQGRVLFRLEEAKVPGGAEEGGGIVQEGFHFTRVSADGEGV